MSQGSKNPSLLYVTDVTHVMHVTGILRQFFQKMKTYVTHVTRITCVTSYGSKNPSPIWACHRDSVTFVTHVTGIFYVPCAISTNVIHVTHVTAIACWNFLIKKNHVTGTRNTRMSHLAVLKPIMSHIW